MSIKTRSNFHPSHALPDVHVHYEFGRKAGMVALFVLAGILALGGVPALAAMTPLGAAMMGASGQAIAIALCGFLFLFSMVAISFAARSLFWLSMQSNTTKGAPTGFLAGMSVAAEKLCR